MRHLDDALLLKILQGQLQPRALLQVMYDHLRDLCPECRANLEMVAGELDWGLEGAPPRLRVPADAPPAAAADAPAYDAAFELAARAALRCAGRLEVERQQAREHLAELRGLPPAERARRVAAGGLASRALAELILETCRDDVRHDPEDVRDLAELVPSVLDALPGADDEVWTEDVRARALAHRGNAFRVGGDMAAAERAFLALRRYRSAHGLELEDLHPEVASLEASLRHEQGRFHDAIELLDVAVRLAQVAGDEVELGRLLVKRGDVHRYDGSLEAARVDLERALALIDPDAEPYLYTCGLGNYCIFLCAVGEHDEAARILDRHEPLFRGSDDPWVQQRATALRAFVAHGRGDAETAERHYLEVRDAFVAADQPFRAALLSLELARLDLEQGRFDELAELAQWIGTVFESRQLPARAAVALMLFQQAAVGRQVTAEALQGLRICLKQAQTSTLRSEPKPS